MGTEQPRSKTRNLLTIGVFMLAALVPLVQAQAQSLPTGSAQPPAAGVLFEKNLGQWSAPVLFRAHAAGYDAFLTKSGMTLVQTAPNVGTLDGHTPPSAPTNAWATTMTLVGANAAPGVTVGATSSLQTNYYVGRDPAQWRLNVPSYAQVTLTNVYPNVDVVYHAAADGGLKYDFLVHPSGNPSSIQQQWTGATQVTTDATGALVIETGLGTMRQGAPLTRQADGAPVANAYTLVNGVVTYAVGAHDASQDLIIDPPIFATYAGHNANEVASSMALDPSNNMLLSGTTTPVSYPRSTGAYQAPATQDVFVTKMNADGSGLSCTAILGGASDDRGFSLTTDATGIYVAGMSLSQGFPTTAGAYQATHAGSEGTANIFEAKLSLACTLTWATFLGHGLRSDDNIAYGIIADPSGVTITGATRDPLYPVSLGGRHLTGPGGGFEAFVTKLNPTGSQLLSSQVLGGTGDDEGHAIATGGSGIYVTGSTSVQSGGLFPTTTGALKAAPAAGATMDAWVSKFDTLGRLVASTYLGAANAAANDIAVDLHNNPYITGTINAGAFPATTGANQAFPGGGKDAFVAKLDSALALNPYATRLGGSNDDIATRIAVDREGNALVAGRTMSFNFPVSRGAYPTYFLGTQDAFVSKVDLTGKALVASVLLGNGTAAASGLAVDPSNLIYVAGTATGSLPTTSGAFRPGASSSPEVFAAKLDLTDLWGLPGPATPNLAPLGTVVIHPTNDQLVRVTYRDVANRTLEIRTGEMILAQVFGYNLLLGNMPWGTEVKTVRMLQAGQPLLDTKYKDGQAYFHGVNATVETAMSLASFEFRAADGTVLHRLDALQLLLPVPQNPLHPGVIKGVPVILNFQPPVSNGTSLNIMTQRPDFPLLPTAQASASSAGAGPTGYDTWCADEHQYCSFSGIRDVAYGHDSRWTYQPNVQGGIQCDNAYFPTDPAYGTFKACYVGPDKTATGPPAGYNTWCASENQYCGFSGTRDLVYGANGHWTPLANVQSPGVQCDNAHFGDPVPNTVKACYMTADKGGSPPPPPPRGGGGGGATGGGNVCNAQPPDSGSANTASGTGPRYYDQYGRSMDFNNNASCKTGGGGGGGGGGTCTTCPPPGYTFCINEGARCSYSGTRNVIYGDTQNQRWTNPWQITGGVDCGNNQFGDPDPGVRKACYYDGGQDGVTPGPAGSQRCASERENCGFTGTRDVYYGANGHFVSKPGVQGGIMCDNAHFGGDPVKDTYKACYTQDTSQPPNACPYQGTQMQHLVGPYSTDSNPGISETPRNLGSGAFQEKWSYTSACNSPEGYDTWEFGFSWWGPTDIVHGNTVATTVSLNTKGNENTRPYSYSCCDYAGSEMTVVAERSFYYDIPSNGQGYGYHVNVYNPFLADQSCPGEDIPEVVKFGLEEIKYIGKPIGILDALIPDSVCTVNLEKLKNSFQGHGLGANNYHESRGGNKMPANYIDTGYSGKGAYQMTLEASSEVDASARSDCYQCDWQHTIYWASMTMQQAGQVR